MIILICNYFKNTRGVIELLVDYGVDDESFCNVPIQTGVPPQELGAEWDFDLNEWVLRD